MLTAIEFSKNLKEIMQRRGVTPSELAVATGKKLQQISRYLTGKQIPERPTLEKIAGVLNTTIGEILQEEKNVTRAPSAAEIESLITLAQGLGFSEDRLELARYALGANELDVAAIIREVRAGGELAGDKASKSGSRK